MHHAKTSAGVALGALSLLILPACDEPQQGRPLPWQTLQAGPEDGDMVLADRAYLVESQPDMAVEVGADELVLHDMTVEHDADWQPGDLLVNAEGVGFLRRVVDIESVGGETVVHTEEAELAEIVAQGSFHGEFRPFSEGLLLPADAPLSDLAGARQAGIGLDDLRARIDAAQGPEVSGAHVELPPTTLVDSHGLTLELTGGHFSFDPDLDLDLDLGWWSIDRFEVMASGAMDAEIGLRLASDGDYEIFDRSMRLWQSPRAAWYGFVGPVPVVVVTQLELDATVSVQTEGPSSVTVGAGASSSVEVGAIYDDGWTMVGDHQFDFSFDGPQFVLETELRAKVALDGKLKVELYDVVGPQLGLSPWTEVRVGADRYWWADIGVKGEIGGAVSLPWRDDLSLDGQLFDWSHRLAEGQL